MRSRYTQIGIIAKYAIKGRLPQLNRFESVLRKSGYSSAKSNETARKMTEFGWIILYHNNVTGDKIYAYRTTYSRASARATPEILSIHRMTKILAKETNHKQT